MKKRQSGEQIVAKLRQADMALGKGLKVPEVCRELGISEQTYYRWRQKYGGMAPEVAKQLKALEKENARLKRLVVIDEYTRECLAIEAGRTFTARDVILTLQYMFALRGAPEQIRSDPATAGDRSS